MRTLSNLPFLCRLLWVALMVLVAVFPAAAQNERVTVTARAGVTAFLDEDIQLEVIIRGSQQAEKPVVPRSDDYTVVGSGFMMNTGSAGSMLAHTFQLRPRRTGELVIPPIDVAVGGRVYRTNEVRVKVYERPASELAYSVIPEKVRVYVGEPIRLRCALRLAGDLFRDPRFTLAGEGDFDLLPHPDHDGTPSSGSIGQMMALGEPTTAVLDGREVPFARSREVIDGVPGDYLIVDQILIARSPGRIAFDRAKASIGVPGRQIGRDFFGRPQHAVENRTLTAKPVEIEVMPLPVAGRPSDFTGLVGRYAVSATIDAREVSVGEPFGLSVTVSGRPPISLVPSLDMARQSELARRFRVPRDPILPAASNASTAIFRTTIRARGADCDHVPPIRLNYFDTESGEYRVAASQPIALTVKPSASVGLEGPDEPGDENEPASKPGVAVMAGPYSFGGMSFRPLGGSSRSGLILWLIAPPALVGIGMMAKAVRERRRVDAAMRRRRRAVRNARREIERIRPEGSPREVAAAACRALTNLAADWFGRPRSTLTSVEARRLLASRSERAAESLAPVLDECDRVGFGPGVDGVLRSGTLITRALDALREADRSLRRIAR
ncbi:MAG: BatD family protein [Phycisphaerales bacterium]